MSRIRIPRRIKHAMRHPHPPAMRHWKLARRYYLRCGFALVVVQPDLGPPFRAVHLRSGAIEREAPPPASCPAFRPDHNGECLTCDEWIDAHTPEAIAAGERLARGDS